MDKFQQNNHSQSWKGQSFMFRLYGNTAKVKLQNMTVVMKGTEHTMISVFMSCYYISNLRQVLQYDVVNQCITTWTISIKMLSEYIHFQTFFSPTYNIFNRL
jgi:hypothetical protein